jgi:PAS domain S-box-containing protein
MLYLRHRLSIRAQLLLLVLSVVLPAAGIFAYYVADESQEAREAAYAKVKILADNTVASLDLVLRDHEAVLKRLAERPLVRALDARNFDPVVGEFIRLHPEFNNLGVRDLHANIIYSYQPNPTSAQATREFAWFEEGIRSGKFTAGNAFLGRMVGRWVSVLTFPVRDDEGKVSGLLNMSLDLLKLNERVFQRSPTNALQGVLDREDQFLLRSTDPAAWIGKPLPGPQADAIRGSSAGIFSMRGVDGLQRLYAVATVPGTQWRVFAGLPEDEVFADYRGRLVRAVVIGLAVLLLVLALAWRIGLTIATPIRELAGTATKIAGGDTGARVRVAGPSEVEYVAQEFNRMLDVQERQREERAALVGHFEQLVRLARDIFLLLDPSGNIVECNAAAVAAYGYSADELRGMNLRDLRAPESQATLEQDWQATAGPGGALFQTVHRRKDGSSFPVEVSAQTIDIQGRSYRQSFIRDITERRAAEAQIRRMNSAYATLSETNQAIVRLHDVNELFPRICRIAVEFGGYLGAWVGLVDEQNRRIVPAAVDGNIDDYVRQISISTDPAQPEGRGPTALAVREGRPYYCQDFLEDPATEPWHELAAEFGVRSSSSLPLRRGGAVIGTLNLYSAEPGVFDAATQALLEEMAVDIAFALDNFEREAARRQAEEALAHSEARFRSMLEQNISAMFMVEGGILTYANRRAGEILGYSAEELIGRAFLDLVVEPDRPNIAAAMRQLLSGEQKSVEGNFGVLRKDETVADIGANAVLATMQGKRAILGIAQDIGERRKAQAEIDRYIGRLERAMQSTLTAVSLMVELRDPYTAGHEHRVGELAAAIGAEMGLAEATVKGLRLAGYVHDIGKVSVPAEILSKPSRLTPIEFELIKGHSQSGYDVLKDVDFPWPLAEVILQHHERLDGSGYPRQLKDGEILLEARIMAVADVVEAMSSHRPYRPGLGIDAALKEIGTNSAKLYDPQVAAACLRLFRDKGYVLAE